MFSYLFLKQLRVFKQFSTVATSAYVWSLCSDKFHSHNGVFGWTISKKRKQELIFDHESHSITSQRCTTRLSVPVLDTDELVMFGLVAGVPASTTRNVQVVTRTVRRARKIM